MIVGVFKHKVNPDFQEEFDNLYYEMAGHIAKIDGYNGHKVYTSEDGEKVLIVEFEDDTAFEAWDMHKDHKRAKERGKAEVFDSYDVSVGKIFERHTKP